VVQQMDSAVLTGFLQKIDQTLWGRVVDRLPKSLADQRVTENDRLEQSAMAAVFAKIMQTQAPADTDPAKPNDGVERCNLLSGFVSTVAVKKSKPSLWSRFLIWVGYKKPEPVYSPAQVQQLICCSPAELSGQLLEKHFPNLDARTFLQLIRNPALCQDNKLMLLNKFFEAKQQQLRNAVYQRVGNQIAQVLQWVEPMELGGVTLLFKDQVFREACKKYLKATEVMSLQKKFAERGIKNAAVNFLNEILPERFKDGPPINMVEVNKLFPGGLAEVAPVTAMLIMVLAAMVSARQAKSRSQLLGGERAAKSAVDLSLLLSRLTTTVKDKLKSVDSTASNGAANSGSPPLAVVYSTSALVRQQVQPSGDGSIAPSAVSSSLFLLPPTKVDDRSKSIESNVSGVTNSVDSGCSPLDVEVVSTSAMVDYCGPYSIWHPLPPHNDSSPLTKTSEGPLLPNNRALAQKILALTTDLSDPSSSVTPSILVPSNSLVQ